VTNRLISIYINQGQKWPAKTPLPEKLSLANLLLWELSRNREDKQSQTRIIKGQQAGYCPLRLIPAGHRKGDPF
jgi:hypothetical protein